MSKDKILPFEMAEIYWNRMRGGAFFVVAARAQIGNEASKAYWNEVLQTLQHLKDGKEWAFSHGPSKALLN